MEKWPPTPYLDHAGVPAFLEEFAGRSRRRGARGVELTSIAATVKALTWPADMAGDERRATVSRLLIESEVAVPAGDGIRFVNVDVQAYLAARHMVRRAPRGPCW